MVLILQDVIGVATMAGMLIKKQNEYIRILGQLGLFSYTFLRSFINKGSGVSLKKLSGIPCCVLKHLPVLVGTRAHN